MVKILVFWNTITKNFMLETILNLYLCTKYVNGTIESTVVAEHKKF